MISKRDVLDVFFAPLVPFVAHPERIVAVAILFFVAALLVTIWRKRIAWAPLVAGVAWACYAGWESHCVEMRYNIRVDLLLVYPLLVAFTIIGAAAIVYSKPLRFPRQFTLRALLILITVVAFLLGIIAWYVRAFKSV